MSPRREVEVEIEGRRLRLSNLDKVFYPATGFTKGDVIDYYRRIAPAVLPHLRDRPLTLKRYPNGVDGPHFYEKRCPSHRPPWIRTVPVWSAVNEEVIHFCVVDDLASLVWAANLADLELHTYLHRAPHVDRPDLLVFDLDPGPPADAIQCCDVALLLRLLFDRLGLASFPKTSGSKGVQVYVPLNTPVTYDETKGFARAVAELLEAAREDLVVSSMKKSLRPGKVLVDWSQNDAHKTTSCVWSLRAKERPTVSTPVTWTEVEAALRRRDAARLAFEAGDALARFERDGDLFAPVLRLRQKLPDAEGVRRALGSLRIRPGVTSAGTGAAGPRVKGGGRSARRRRASGVGRTAVTPESGHPQGRQPPRRGAGTSSEAADGYLSTE